MKMFSFYFAISIPKSIPVIDLLQYQYQYQYFRILFCNANININSYVYTKVESVSTIWKISPNYILWLCFSSYLTFAISFQSTHLWLRLQTSPTLRASTCLQGTTLSRCDQCHSFAYDFSYPFTWFIWFSSKW